MYADPSRPEVGTGFETERKANFKNMTDYTPSRIFTRHWFSTEFTEVTERAVEARNCGEEETPQALAETGRIPACAPHGAVFHLRVEVVIVLRKRGA
jgi:hypothetical protein